MFENISTVLIWSEDFRKLADWYEATLDLQPIESINHPEDTGVLYKIGNTQLWIGQHDKVHGKNQDQHRWMININVTSVDAAYDYLKNKGVTFIATPFKAPTFDKYFATFEDVDGNLLQLIGPR